MSQTQETQENATPSEEAEPMNGMGMSLDAVRTMLLREHNLAVSPDDPLLAVASINNAFLHELQDLLARHQTALTAVMSEATASTVKAIQDEARIFAADFKEAAIQNTLAKVGEHQRAMGQFLGTVEALCRETKVFAAVMAGGSALFFAATLGVALWWR